MGFVMPHIFILIGLCVVGVALLFQIVGLATNGWLVYDKHGVDYEAGLWEDCLNGKCSSGGDVPSWMKACRAFGILGIFAMAASVVSGLLICFMSDRKALFTLIAPVAAAVGALCALVEFAVFVGEFYEKEFAIYTRKTEKVHDYFGYSFALTVVVFFLCIGAAVLFFLGRMKSQ